ncbi:PHD finger alfin-like protein [Quillaja saponaria]|uniref:PHD finger protein ALFIN-LIKE n=1 Tax=Quillaja saponaria TaxID=32244 RepID=A0AAD7QDL1_QUISA|nr:PHD finger alfin-like protein [Quillaja saponaria]
MIKVLTTDVDEFYQLCNPEKENLCLYGYPNEQWQVNFPTEEVPPELPEPTLGINFARDGMQEKDWLSLVAVHNDAWLLSVAFCYGAGFGFDKADRKRLFTMINDLPTIFEVVTGTAKKQANEKSSVSTHGSNKSKSGSKVVNAISLSL